MLVHEMGVVTQVHKSDFCEQLRMMEISYQKRAADLGT